MQQYFVDAWYVIALINRFDQDHAAAQRMKRALGRAELLSHDGVFMEVLAFYSGFGTEMRRTAATIVRQMMRGIKVFPADRTLFLVGLDLYERRADKAYSLVDCMSMVLMRTHGITHVLTNDHHFRQEGFTVLADAP